MLWISFRKKKHLTYQYFINQQYEVTNYYYFQSLDTVKILVTFSNKICYDKHVLKKQNNEIARNNEIGGNSEMRKFQDFLQNLHDIAFAHQCAKTSKFRAIFTRNVRKSLHNFCTTFLQKNRLETLPKRLFLKIDHGPKLETNLY